MKNLTASAPAALLALCTSFLFSLTSCEKAELPALSTANENALSSNTNASIAEETSFSKDTKHFTDGAFEQATDKDIRNHSNGAQPRLDKDSRGGNTAEPRLDKSIRGGNTNAPRLD